VSGVSHAPGSRGQIRAESRLVALAPARYVHGVRAAEAGPAKAAIPQRNAAKPAKRERATYPFLMHPRRWSAATLKARYPEHRPDRCLRAEADT
jgi:hypothetical protein